jgi:hypothetical protein
MIIKKATLSAWLFCIRSSDKLLEFASGCFFDHLHISKYSSTVFAHDDFLFLPDVGLALRRNLVETTTASSTSNLYHCQSVDGILTDPVVAVHQAIFDFPNGFNPNIPKLFLVFRAFGNDGIQL